MGNIAIRKVREKDCEILVKLGAETFRQTYKDKVNSRELSSYIKITFNKDILLKEIKNPSFIFLIASKNGNSVGYAKSLENKIPPNVKKFRGIELVRLYVLREYLRQKIGSKLLKEYIKIAKKKNFNFIWLAVWERNHNAIPFYKKVGFKIFSQYKFNFGTKLHNDILMRKKIF